MHSIKYPAFVAAFFSVLFVSVISLITNNSYVHIMGFFFTFLFAYTIVPFPLPLAVLVALSAFIFIFIDPTLLASKQLLSLFSVFIFDKSKSLPLILSISTYGFAKILYLLLFVFIVIGYGYQLLASSYSIGFYGIPRFSSFAFDPNYFAVFIVFLALTTPSKSLRRALFVPLVVTQSLTCLFSYLLRKRNYVLVALYVVFIFLVYADFQFSRFFEDLGIFDLVQQIFGENASNWFHSRTVSIDQRLSWASSLVLYGDTLDGIAPHVSLFTGLKKNATITIYYFLILLALSFRKSTFLGLVLVQSLGVDVFFGPLCFLVPIYLAL